MKNIISLVVLMSSVLIAQTSESKSLIELKQLSAVSYKKSESYIEYPSTINHHPVLSIRNQVSSTQKKNPALAILYSMLIPGMGELYANSYESGKYFTIADGVLWSVFTGFTIYGTQQDSNYKSFAESRAGVKVDGKDADYFANVGAYLSLDDYNTSMELNRRFESTYKASTHYWKWSGDDQRKEYRSMWTSSESAFTNVRFVVGALILNRVISAINAVRLVSAYNKNLAQEMSWSISVGVESYSTLPSSITFNFVKTF
ncbi:hypothetical protein C0389_08540 [bacterium]|nr:hypothetical protein [bacterium]